MSDVKSTAEAVQQVTEQVVSVWDADSLQQLFDLLSQISTTLVFILAVVLFVSGLILALIFSRRLGV